MITTILPANLVDGVLVPGGLAVDAVPEKFQITQEFVYRLAAKAATKATATAIALPAAKTINTGAAAGQFWGIVTIQATAAGVVTGKTPAADQVYTTEALAIAAKPDPDADNVRLGYLTIQTLDATAWTSVTDSLTDDVAAANFYVEPAIPRVLTHALMQPRAFRWVGATDAAHTVVVADHGQAIWEAIRGTDTAPIDDSRLAEKFPQSLFALDVWTLDSGKLYIYHC